ncbi:MAG: TonB-dependent receptor plug domain-containing protein [Archangium sp.]
MISVVLLSLLSAGEDAGVPPQERVTVVTASRAERGLQDSTIATEVITREDIEATGSVTLGDLLEEHANLDVTRGLNGQNVRLQGMDMKYLLILVDGERVTGRIDGDIDLTRFMAEDIERVEIVRGPGSALYGADAIAGVVNIITRRGRKPFAGDVNVAGGSLGLFDLGGSASTKTGPFRARISMGYHRGDGWDRDPSDVATTGPRFDQANVAGRFEWQATETTSLEARAEYFYRDTSRVDLGAGGAVFDRSNRTETLTLGLTPKGSTPFGLTWRIGAHYTLFRDQYLNDQRNAAALDQYQETWDHLTQLSALGDVKLGDSHAVTAGVEGYAEFLKSDRVSDFGQRYRFAIFAQDEWSILTRPKLALVPGIRLDVDTQFGAAPSPRLAARFDPHETVTLRASGGLGFRAPSFRELLLNFQNPGVGYIVEGNPALRPERSWSVNVSGEWRPILPVTVSANLFHNELTDLIQPISAGTNEAGQLTRYVYTNIDRAFTQGLESSVRVTPLPQVSVDLSYMLLNAINRATGQQLEGRSAHRGTADLRVQLFDAKVKGSLRTSISSPRPYYTTTDANGALVPQWTKSLVTLDANVTFTPVRWVTLGVLAENLLDNGDALLLTMQPRTFMLTAAVRY